MKKAEKKIRDSVHKDIYLDAGEIELIDTPEMQRLRGVRQLGTALYVYPGAQHSRFEHCLGACWMAKKIIAALERHENRNMPEMQKKAVCLAALIHDITHIPFGHTFEDERKLLPRHDRDEDRFDRLIASGSPGRLLAASEAGRLALDMLNPSVELPPEHLYLKQIVDGTICADLLDYLKRDNYYCGLSQLYDDRIFLYFRLHHGRLMLALHHDGIFRHDAQSEITHLLRIRYVLSERVYYHHAKAASGAVIARAIERALMAGMQKSELYTLRDDALPLYLKNTYGGDRALCELVDMFTARRFYKRCYMLTRRIGEDNVAALEKKYHHNQQGCRNKLEAQIAAEAGAEPHEVAVFCPSAAMALKEAEMDAICGSGTIARFCDLNSAEVRMLQQQHRALWKFYVFVSPRLAAEKLKTAGICSEILGFPNEMPEKI